MNYGECLSNYELFYTYGFIQEQNPQDKVLFTLEMSEDEDRNENKLKELK